jgi:ZIP family zinc transporter
MIILIALATFLATLIGGLVALRLKDKLHLILGFSAGAVIGVAFFDLIPESIEIGSKYFSNSFVMSLVALGFIVYLILDRVVFLHVHEADSGESHHHDAAPHQSNDRETEKPAALPAKRGILGAGSLSLHSFLDGVAIGLAFQVSAGVGTIVAVAVLVHDFSDGINTVGLILKSGGSWRSASKWLLADSVAPLLGVLSTLLFSLPERSLGIVLALFSGFFLYIGASDLIPESHHAHPKFLTTAMTILGAGVLFLAVRLAGF